MAVLGIPSDIWPNNGLSDARIFFCLTTLVVAALGPVPLPGRRAAQDPRPAGARHPAPGVAARWRRAATTSPSWPSCCWPWCWPSGASPSPPGVVLGIASAMKFTAWPLAVLALFAARGRKGERRPLSMLAGHARGGGAGHLPVRCCGARSPSSTTWCCSRSGSAPSPRRRPARCPGTSSSRRSPRCIRALPLSVGLVLAVLLARHLYRRTPRTTSPRSAPSPAS